MLQLQHNNRTLTQSSYVHVTIHRRHKGSDILPLRVISWIKIGWCPVGSMVGSQCFKLPCLLFTWWLDNVKGVWPVKTHRKVFFWNKCSKKFKAATSKPGKQQLIWCFSSALLPTNGRRPRSGGGASSNAPPPLNTPLVYLSLSLVAAQCNSFNLLLSTVAQLFPIQPILNTVAVSQQLAEK